MSAKNVKMPDKKVQKFATSLRVQLTPEEIADRAERAAHKLNERDDKEAELKAAQKHAKSIVEQLEAELRQLSNEVRTRSTFRSVDCERHYDYKDAMIREVRLDTAEVFFERKMNYEESQRELPFEETEGS